MVSDLSTALHHLHGLLLQLSEAEAALADGPKAIAESEQQITLAEQRIEEKKATIKLTRKASDELNLRLKTKEAELKKLEGQLNAASSNKEFDIFKGQIAHQGAERADFESEALEAMEAIDGTQAQLKNLEAELKNHRQAAQSVRAEVEAKQPGLATSLEVLNSQIAECEKVIPGDAIQNYRRLRIAHGSGALAEIEDDFCSGCDSRVTNQDLVRIRIGEFHCCRSCNRALYVL